MEVPGDKDPDDEVADYVTSTRRKLADKLGISTEELAEKTITDIEDELGVKTAEPKLPIDDRGGYFVSSLYEVLTGDELEARKKRVKKYLDKLVN